jgi:hypothetical protein
MINYMSAATLVDAEMMIDGGTVLNEEMYDDKGIRLLSR